MALTRLPGSKWWVETDDVTGDITATRAQIVDTVAAIRDTVAAIRDTLTRYPEPAQDDADVADLLTAIAGRWTDAKRARIVGLVNTMYGSYQTNDPAKLEAANLRARLESLTALRDRLV